jgi:eukaryotic translation initiation factor 2C
MTQSRDNNAGRGRAGFRGGVPSSAPGRRGGQNWNSTRDGRPSNTPLIYKEGQQALIDPSLSGSGELVTRLGALNHGPEHPARPGCGSLGRAIVVRANFFPVELSRETYYDYVVEITPEPKSQKSRVKRRVLALFEQSTAVRPYVHKIAHDGVQRLVAAERLPQPLRGNVEYFEDGDDGPPPHADRYSVEVKFSRELATAPLKLCV